MDIPEKQRFFILLEVDPCINAAHLDLDILRFYNKDGEDITKKVDWSGLI